MQSQDVCSRLAAKTSEEKNIASAIFFSFCSGIIIANKSGHCIHPVLTV